MTAKCAAMAALLSCKAAISKLSSAIALFFDAGLADAGSSVTRSGDVDDRAAARCGVASSGSRDELSATTRERSAPGQLLMARTTAGQRGD